MNIADGKRLPRQPIQQHSSPPPSKEAILNESIVPKAGAKTAPSLHDKRNDPDTLGPSHNTFASLADVSMSIAAAQQLPRLSVYGLPMSSNDLPSSGFTAVNGDKQHSAFFRLGHTSEEQPTKRETPRQAPPERPVSPVHHHAYSRQPESHVSHTPQPKADEPRKRKRSQSPDAGRSENAQGGQRQSIETSSPKRRIVHLDSAIDVSSPSSSNPSGALYGQMSSASRPLSIGAYTR